MLTPYCATAVLAVSRLCPVGECRHSPVGQWTALTHFSKSLLRVFRTSGVHLRNSADRSACSSQHTFASDDGSLPPYPSSRKSKTRPFHRIWRATCKNLRCFGGIMIPGSLSTSPHSRARGTAPTPPPPSACFRIDIIWASLNRAVFIKKYPQLSCRENSTFEHH